MFAVPKEQLDAYIFGLSQQNKDEDISWYMQFGGGCTVSDDEGRTAAHNFAIRGNERAMVTIAQYELEAFERADNAGMTPLMHLAKCTYIDVKQFALCRPQLLAQTDNKGRSVASFLITRGQVSTVLDELLPICPEIIHQNVISHLMGCDLAPMEKIRLVRVLSRHGFKPA